jgi:hypothetical protein
MPKGSIGSAELTKECFATMEDIKKAYEEYSANDIYNIDETRLFWN